MKRIGQKVVIVGVMIAVAGIARCINFFLSDPLLRFRRKLSGWADTVFRD